MKRQTFEGLVLRALNVLLHTVARYAGPKTDEIVARWKQDAREYLNEPWQPAEDEIAHAEAVAEPKPPCGDCGQPLGSERNCPTCQIEWLTDDMDRKT
jgi:hypothetical protein